MARCHERHYPIPDTLEEACRDHEKELSTIERTKKTLDEIRQAE